MKNPVPHLKTRGGVLLLCLIMVLSSFAPALYDVIKLEAEPNHSTIQFAVPIANGLTRVTGKFTDFSIDIDYVDNDLSKSGISAIIKAESINTGIEGRDEHLRSKDFFETEKYPEITFTSTAIVKTGNGYMVQGDFSMHGITKKLEIPVKITGMNGKYTIGFTSRLSLKRSDFNLGTEFKHTSIKNFINDEIHIEIDFWTRKQKNKSN